MKQNSLLRLILACVGLAVLSQALWADSFVKNPSFESNYNDTYPHYGTIDEWNGGSGVNEDAGPFHNTGTAIPDQTRVAESAAIVTDGNRFSVTVPITGSSRFFRLIKQ